VNRKDTKAQRDRVARVVPLHQDKSIIARPQAAQDSFKTSLLAGTASQHLRSSAFICGSEPSSVPQAAQESNRNALLAGTAPYTRPLRVFAPSRFNPSQPAAAGHGLDRSVSPLRSTAAPLHVTASRLTAAPLLPHMSKRRAIG
jgi:hypothetical protein